MWNKIFFTALILALLPICFLTFYAHSWLQSIGDPRVALENFTYYAGLAWLWLWISFVGLLIIANIVLWQTRRAWAMWTTAVYFVLFLMLRAFWLDGAAFAFMSANSLPLGTVAIGPFLTFIVFALAVAIIFFNQFIVVRMSEKMYPPAIEPAVPEESADE
jgi:hypothetical protein